jgi:hypothetical protein
MTDSFRQVSNQSLCPASLNVVGVTNPRQLRNDEQRLARGYGVSLPLVYEVKLRITMMNGETYSPEGNDSLTLSRQGKTDVFDISGQLRSKTGLFRNDLEAMSLSISDEGKFLTLRGTINASKRPIDNRIPIKSNTFSVQIPIREGNSTQSLSLSAPTVGGEFAPREISIILLNKNKDKIFERHLSIDNYKDK